MSATTMVVMILILGFVWGGLVSIMLVASRKEREKGASQAVDP